jgi:hypothetical protein
MYFYSEQMTLEQGRCFGQTFSACGQWILMQLPVLSSICLTALHLEAEGGGGECWEVYNVHFTTGTMYVGWGLAELRIIDQVEMLSWMRSSHRLKMEVDLQSLFGLRVTWCAQLFSLAETPQLPPSPRIWTRITRALLVSKDRRHLFVTPWI